MGDLRWLTEEQVAECHEDPFLWHMQDFVAVDVYVRDVEAERDALRERVERLREGYEYLLGADVAGWEGHMRVNEVCRKALRADDEAAR